MLDDVVSTVDAKHRENICKLLLGEFRDTQLIITTHDEVWYEQLRAFQRAYRIAGNFKNLIITNWNVESGPTIAPYTIKWERIQEKIDSGDKPGAGNGGRQYLEWLLKHICKVTNAPVPVNDWQGGMVNGILPHAEKRLKNLIKEDEFKEKISKAFKDLETTIIMGNLLSHNNVLAEEVSIEEVKTFCESVHSLHNAFLCPTCGHFVNYYYELKIIRCPNTKCETPLEVKTK